MNGERLSTITAAGGQEFVNINVVPTIAVGQVEVLRDGAAATYGSDAVAGVVNFITRRDLDGFEVNGKYALIDGSDGDYETSAAWGRKFDNGNMLLAASYRHRSELNGVDLPWTLPNAVFPDTLNISGISGASNPGGYNAILGTPVIGPNGGFVQDPTRPGIPLGATLSPTFSDAGCTQLGGLSFVPNGQCFYPFTYHDTRVANEDHYHLFGEANLDLSDNLRFHGEVLWSRTVVPDDRVSASQGTTQFPTPVEASGASPGRGHIADAGGARRHPVALLCAREQPRPSGPVQSVSYRDPAADHGGDLCGRTGQWRHHEPDAVASGGHGRQPDPWL